MSPPASSDSIDLSGNSVEHCLDMVGAAESGINYHTQVFEGLYRQAVTASVGWTRHRRILVLRVQYKALSALISLSSI